MAHTAKVELLGQEEPAKMDEASAERKSWTAPRGSSSSDGTLKQVRVKEVAQIRLLTWNSG